MCVERDILHLARLLSGYFSCHCYTLTMFRRIFRLFLGKALSIRVFSVFLLLSFAAFVLSTACHPIDYSSISSQEPNQCCSEQHELKNALPEHITVFDEAALPTSPLGVMAVLISIFTIFLPRKIDRLKPLALTARDRRLRWVWAKSLPFSSQDVFLPYLVATRAA